VVKEGTDLLLDFGKDYFSIVNPGGAIWGCTEFNFGESIPEATFSSFLAGCNNLKVSNELPIIYVRENLHGPLNQGMLLTSDNLYYNLIPNLSEKYVLKKINLDDVKTLTLKLNIFSADLIINGKMVALIKGWAKIGIYSANILTEYISWVIAIREALLCTQDYQPIDKPLPGASQLDRLIYLNSMYTNGMLDPEEYAVARKRIVIHMIAERRAENAY